MKHTIVPRFDREKTLYEGEAETLKDLVGTAVKNGADLSGADLFGADLFGADLSGADLRAADLSGADLRRADLSGADLSGANLSRADLSRADLSRATINWNSHALIAELLRQSAVDDIEKRKIAGLIAISTDWCWSKWLKLRHEPNFDWAIDALATFVKEGDEAPEILIKAAAKLKEQTK